MGQATRSADRIWQLRMILRERGMIVSVDRFNRLGRLEGAVAWRPQEGGRPRWKAFALPAARGHNPSAQELADRLEAILREEVKR